MSVEPRILAVKPRARDTVTASNKVDASIRKLLEYPRTRNRLQCPVITCEIRRMLSWSEPEQQRLFCVSHGRVSRIAQCVSTLSEAPAFERLLSLPVFVHGASARVYAREQSVNDLVFLGRGAEASKNAKI